MSRPKLRIEPNALRSRRLSAVLTHAQLARQAGISEQRLRELEAGNRPGTTVQTVQALAAVLGCDGREISVVVEEAAS